MFAYFGVRAKTFELDHATPSFRERLALRMEGTLNQAEEQVVVPRSSSASSLVLSTLESSKADAKEEEAKEAAAAAVVDEEEPRKSVVDAADSETSSRRSDSMVDAPRSRGGDRAQSVATSSVRSKRTNRTVVRDVQIADTTYGSGGGVGGGSANGSASGSSVASPIMSSSFRRKGLRMVDFQVVAAPPSQAPPQAPPPPPPPAVSNNDPSPPPLPPVEIPGSSTAITGQSATTTPPVEVGSPAISQGDELRKRVATLKREAGTGWLKAYQEMNATPSLRIVSPSSSAEELSGSSSVEKLSSPSSSVEKVSSATENRSTDPATSSTAIAPKFPNTRSPPAQTQNGARGGGMIRKDKKSPPRQQQQQASAQLSRTSPSPSPSPSLRTSGVPPPVRTSSSPSTSRTTPPMIPSPVISPPTIIFASPYLPRKSTSSVAMGSLTAVTAQVSLPPSNSRQRANGGRLSPVESTMMGPFIVDVVHVQRSTSAGETTPTGMMELLSPIPREVTVNSSTIEESAAGLDTRIRRLSQLFTIEPMPFDTLQLEFRSSPFDIDVVQYGFRRRDEGNMDDQLIRDVFDRLQTQMAHNRKMGLEKRTTFRYRCIRCSHEFASPKPLQAHHLVACPRCQANSLVDLTPAQRSDSSHQDSSALFKIYDAERSRDHEAYKTTSHSIPPGVLVHFKLNLFQHEQETALCWVPCNVLYQQRRRFGRPVMVDFAANVLLTQLYVYIFEVDPVADTFIPVTVNRPETQLKTMIRIPLDALLQVEVGHYRQSVTLHVPSDLGRSRKLSGSTVDGTAVPYTLFFMDYQRCSELVNAVMVRLDEMDRIVDEHGVPRIHQDNTDLLRNLVLEHTDPVDQTVPTSKKEVVDLVGVYVAGRLAAADALHEPPSSSDTATLRSYASSILSTSAANSPMSSPGMRRKDHPGPGGRRYAFAPTVLVCVRDKILLVEPPSSGVGVVGVPGPVVGAGVPGLAQHHRTVRKQSLGRLRAVSRVRTENSQDPTVVVYGVHLQFEDSESWHVQFPTTRNVEVAVAVLKRYVDDEAVGFHAGGGDDDHVSE